MNLRSLNIGKRSALIFSFIGALALIIGLTGIIQARAMNASAEEIRNDWLPGVKATGEIANNIGRIRSLSLRTFIEHDVEDLNTIKKLKEILSNSLSNYEKTSHSEKDRALYAQFNVEYSHYLLILDKFLASQSSSDSELAVNIIKNELSPQADKMVIALNDLTQFNSDNADRASDASEGIFHEAIQTITSVLVVIFIAIIASSYMLTRSIVRPLSEAMVIAQRIAHSDLTQALQIEYKDEPGQLLLSLKTMQHNLRQTIQQIANSSDQLASAAEELHAVTEDTNRGLHQQSAEIDQAATAVNEMTAAVEEVANNAVDTAEASKEADATTQQGREKVEQALTSIQQLVDEVSMTSDEIGELAHRANEINRVLDVIGEIAGQTNLLALNAAIEAARAGEAGRGFAVVADEVRALAHRTQQSTGEIEHMISGIRNGTIQAVDSMQSSQNRANSTLEIAQAAGHALNVISQAMSTINERNLVIASASEEQAQVAREVDRNLVNIRDLSTQTSAGSNQTSTASQELSRLAIELNGLIANFKI
ncbi:methyl-accepting chemotaxis protein [Pseudomonas protegens]